MSRRDYVLQCLLGVGALLLIPWVFQRISSRPFTRHQIISLVLAALATPLTLAGKKLLMQNQHAKLFRAYMVIVVVLFIPLVTKSVTGESATMLYYAIVAASVGLLPMGLLLNRGRRGSTG
jgi:surface polysaccharide O-acyltransferase-like enzyme